MVYAAAGASRNGARDSRHVLISSPRHLFSELDVREALRVAENAEPESFSVRPTRSVEVLRKDAS